MAIHVFKFALDALHNFLTDLAGSHSFKAVCKQINYQMSLFAYKQLWNCVASLCRNNNYIMLALINFANSYKTDSIKCQFCIMVWVIQ